MDDSFKERLQFRQNNLSSVHATTYLKEHNLSTPVSGFVSLHPGAPGEEARQLSEACQCLQNWLPGHPTVLDLLSHGTIRPLRDLRDCVLPTSLFSAEHVI